MVKKTSADAGAYGTASFEDYRAAIKHLLIVEHGAPELVADDLILADDGYLRASWNNKTPLLEVADEIALKPNEDQVWVKIGNDKSVIKISAETCTYLEEIAELGLYGETRDEVARAMIARGLESVLPLAAAATAIRKHRTLS